MRHRGDVYLLRKVVEFQQRMMTVAGPEGGRLGAKATRGGRFERLLLSSAVGAQYN